ncbi:MAG: pentapeptide repeat-containing protein [Caldisericales bacterium]|nr:pentapeptide repeat-containing protein [Caldisericales bacterium]
MKTKFLAVFAAIFVVVSVNLAQFAFALPKICIYESDYMSMDQFGKTSVVDYKCQRAVRDGDYCPLHSHTDGKKNYELTLVKNEDSLNSPMIGCYLRGVNLSYYTLHSMIWSKSDFTKANLSYAMLSSKVLLGCNFSEANLEKSDFGYSFAYNANFNGTNLEKCNMVGAWLEGSSFKGAVCKETYFVSARLDGTDFSGAKFEHIFFMPGQFAKAMGMEAVNWGDFKVGTEIIGSYGEAIQCYDDLAALYDGMGKKDFADKFSERKIFCQRQLEVLGANNDKKQSGPHISLVVGLVLVALTVVLTMVVILGRRKRSDARPS